MHAPTAYRACESDLIASADARAYWLELFATHIRVQVDHAHDAGLIDQAAGDRTVTRMASVCRMLGADPERLGRLDILVLDAIRRHLLAIEGVRDEFRLIKTRENVRSIEALPARLAVIDALDPRERHHSIMSGLVAGNLFDMGARATAARFGRESPSFDRILGELPPRPWYRDDVEAAASLVAEPASRTLIFVDNAGGDVVLGTLPLARELVRQGGTVAIAANAEPALNDVTAEEVVDLLERAATVTGDPVFRSPAIEVVDSGNRAPLIDLADVSAELADASASAGAVVLQGMGRGIESNWTAEFRVPVLRAAILKDPQVADSIGGRMLDPIIRVDEPAAG